MARRLKITEDEILERPFNRDYWRRLFEYLKPYKLQLAIALGLMVISSVASLAGPYFMSLSIDIMEKAWKGVEEVNTSLVYWYVGGMVATTAIVAICVRYRVRIMDSAGRKAIATLRQDLFNHIQDLAMPFFDSRSAGKIMVRVINDVNSLNDLFTNGIISLLIDCLTLVLLLIIMFFVNWKLTLISIALVPILSMIIFLLRRTIRKRWQLVRAKISNMNGFLHESLAGVRVTQAFVREEENHDMYVDVNQDIRTSWMQAIKVGNIFWPCIDMVSVMGTVLVYIFGVRMMNSGGGVSLAEMLLIIWYLGRFWDPLNSLSNFYNSLLVAMASAERIFDIMDTPIDIRDTSEDMPELPEITGRVDFENVSFAYDRDKIVLKNVSFSVQPGQTVALVGPTGAGKSTVVNLLSRFYEITDGSIKIDGYDIRDVKLHSLRRQMSVMLQDSFIFSGTIMENIRYGKLDATDEEVIEAAKSVRAHDFIMKKEKGYNTEVNERGSSLSVGEKQLISFARALLNDPKILILDEATSSIDTHTEMLIQQALERLLKGRTSFVIAHRLSTIRKADNILVIQDGDISESGNHDELMRNPDGHYYKLCQAQYRFLKTG